MIVRMLESIGAAFVDVLSTLWRYFEEMWAAIKVPFTWLTTLNFDPRSPRSGHRSFWDRLRSDGSISED